MNSTLGLGCVTFGREIDERKSFEMISYAHEHGIYELDTAAVYGNGASEEIIGKWLAENPEKALQTKVATKVVPPFDGGTIRRSVEQSLKRLKLDAIELLYFHRWDDKLGGPEPWLALEALVAEGKVNQIGVSNFSGNQLDAAVRLLQKISPLRIAAVQQNHNLAVSDLGPGLLACCQQHQIRIITFSPLGAGFLTGKHLQGIQPGSRFEVMPAHQDIYGSQQARQSLLKLMEISRITGYEPAFLALAWAMHQPHTSQVLVGGRSIAQLKLALKASRFGEIFELGF